MQVKPEVAETIRGKKAQYCRYIDTKQWDKFETLGLPDSTFAFFNPDGSPMTVGRTALTFPSPKAFTTNLKKNFADVRTLHLVGVGDLRQIGEEEVYAIWSMQDQIILKNSLGLFWMRGGGYYHETWLCQDGEWYLKSFEARDDVLQEELAGKRVVVRPESSGLTGRISRTRWIAYLALF